MVHNFGLIFLPKNTLLDTSKIIAQKKYYFTYIIKQTIFSAFKTDVAGNNAGWLFAQETR